jgi:cytoskeletal protein RodZ
MTQGRGRPVDLTGWRKKKGVSLSEIAAATKISLRYLEAIEREKFRSLPGGAYGLGYIRQYAEAIHYDVDRLVERYRVATSEPPPPPPDKWIRRLWSRIRQLPSST